MAIKIVNLDMTLKLGSVDVSAAYLGDTKLYPTTPPSFDGKWLATYTSGTTSSAECDSSSAITQNEITLTDLESVVIADCVTNIGQYAFNSCSGLTSVTIPDSVTSIDNWAFLGCSGLPSIDIPSGVTNINDGAFFGCTSLTSIDIPNSVTEIGSWAFQMCTGLTSITIPSGVTSIGDNAFYGCSGLTSITVEATTPPTLGSSAFGNTNDCPIYVPSASVEAYQAQWSDYASRIQAIPNS